jgi:hypothetical protein
MRRKWAAGAARRRRRCKRRPTRAPNPASFTRTSIDDTDSTYTWYVLNADNSENVKKTLNGQTGQQIVFKPTITDSGSVFGIAVKRTDSTGTVLSSQKFQVACKYVRREFRELCDKDREAYFDALSIMYHTSTEEGVSEYGDKFRGSGA